MTGTIPFLQPEDSKRWWGSLFSIPLLIVTVALVALAFLNSAAYVRSYVDDTAYHIPMAVEIARHHNPYYVDSDAAFTSFWFPAGAETVVAAIIAVTRDINSTNLSGALFYLLFLLVSYQFAGLWTGAFPVRLLCVALSSIIPVLFAQTRAFYVDIHIGFLVYLSLYLYALSTVKEDANYGYLGIGVALLSASVKYHGLIFCAVLLPVGIFCVSRSRNRRPAPWVLLIVSSCVIFVSGWYIRNLLMQGNPIYPLPLPHSLRFLPATLGLSYQGMDQFPDLSPRTQLPYPLIPKALAYASFRPDITEDAFGLGFPLSLVMCAIAGWRAKRMTIPRQRAYWLTIVTTVAIVLVLPFRLSVPRYILFVPAIAALSPAMLAASVTDQKKVYQWISVCVLAASLVYVGGNLLDDRMRKTFVQDPISLLLEKRNSGIVHFDTVERGNLRIGYLGGRYAFIAALYDRKMTNQLVQLHYQDYLLDRGTGFADPGEFVKYIQSLDLDYIWIFDTKAPGAQIIASNFPDKVFVEDIYK